MDVPGDRKYSSTHEWHKLEDDVVTIGLTEHAVNELTDITYVELPEKGDEVAEGDAFGEIESVKATSELYSGVTGEVADVNETLVEDPGAVNRSPYEEGWLIKVKASDISELDKLMDSEEYENSLE